MSTKNEIINIFLQNIDDTKINICELDNYVQFCIDNDTRTKINGKTSYHHILPRGKNTPFKQYENLKDYSWNGVHLTHYNHYYAHYLLSKAIALPIYLYIFIAMHNKDKKLNRLCESELIPKDEFTLLMETRNKNISNDRKTLVFHNGEYITKAKMWKTQNPLSSEILQKMSDRMKGENNIVNKKGVVEKIRKTKQTTIIDGKNLDSISALRASETMKKEILDEYGNITTQYKLNAIKLSNHLNTEIVLEDGTISTIAKERGKIKGKKMREQGKKYVLKNVFDDTYSIVKYAVEIREISPGLEHKTKENYLGMSKFGQTHLKKHNKDNLIGLYVEILPLEL